MSDNVIHIDFRSPHTTDDDGIHLLSCKYCRNKSFTFHLDGPLGDGFPLMKCCACGQHMGRMGWVHDDDPAVSA